MSYQSYYTPHASNRLDTSQPCTQSIADLLLNHGNNPPTNSRLCRTVTVPDEKLQTGWRVAACQVFVPVYRWKVIVDLRDKDRTYEFREMKISQHGREHLGYISRRLSNDEFEALNLSWDNADAYDWYHFTGTAPQILEELKKSTGHNLHLG